MLDVAWSASPGGQCCGSLSDVVIWSCGWVLQSVELIQSYLQQEDIVYDSSQYFTFWILLHQKQYCACTKIVATCGIQTLVQCMHVKVS